MVFQIQKCMARPSTWVASMANVFPGLGRVSGWLNYWQSNGLHVIPHKKTQHLKANVHVQFARQTKMCGYRPGGDFIGGGDQKKTTLYLFQTGRARCGREMRHNWSMGQIQVATERLNSGFWIRAVVNMSFPFPVEINSRTWSPNRSQMQRPVHLIWIKFHCSRLV